MTPEVGPRQLSKMAAKNLFDAFNLLQDTRGWMAEQARNGHSISLPLAIATKMYRDKQRELSRFTFHGEKQGLMTVYDNLYYQVGEKSASDFMRMAGGMILKSILTSLERGAVNGWSDDIFMQELNFNIEDTPIAQFESNSSAKWENPEDRFVRLNRETDLIRRILVNDTTFLGFFKQDEEGEYRELPKSMQIFFDENPEWKRALDLALPVFSQACLGDVSLQDKHSRGVNR